MKQCLILTKLSFAMDPVNSTALLGNVHLRSLASAIQMPSDFGKTIRIFYKACFIHVFKPHTTKTLLDGSPQED